MTGKLKIYLLFGFIGFLITYAVSAGNNMFTTSLVRGLTAFAVWFLLCFIGGWVFEFLKEQGVKEDDEVISAIMQAQGKGGNLDLTTPDQSDELNDLLKQPVGSSSQDTEFAPLNPPKLTKIDDKDPEELAKVVRHLTEE
ncbi:hypothetical protein J41TS12_09990 [Paenibacillus antibioticophila]|uniref:Uncharacterized protein n=1 Tax=Paenibacillus antibioticophila TaxID=1274374 RepID=A0A919XTM2_9BACL|nr:hypothetical protein [Paenibacillus antibioticophila]GIO36138.1 hypothetical protein J41TS12_09990 [Paenibacillus antibioticophila]